MSYEYISRQVHQYRKANNFTQEQMAEKLSMDKHAYERFERNEKKDIGLDFIKHIAEITGIDEKKLLFPDSIFIESLRNDSHNNSTAIIWLNTEEFTVQGNGSDIILNYQSAIATLLQTITERDKTICELSRELQRLLENR